MVWVWAEQPHIEAGRSLSPSHGQRLLPVPVPSAHFQVPASGSWPARPDGGPQIPHFNLPASGNGVATPPVLPSSFSLPFPAAADPALASPSRRANAGAAVAHQPDATTPPRPFPFVPVGSAGQVNAAVFMRPATHERQLINVPVQSLTPPPGFRPVLQAPGDAATNGLLSKIGGILSEAERELAEDQTNSCGNSPAMDWLDRKIAALQDRQHKRTEQQTYLSELRHMIAGTGNAYSMDGGLDAICVPTLPASGSSSNENLALDAVDADLLKADQAVLRQHVQQLRRQRMEYDREREELLRVKSALEAEAEGRLKDTQSVAEAIEAGERRASYVEENAEGRVKRVEMLCEALQEKLTSTEAALEKERLISKEALDVQASAESDLSAVKDISHKVLGDCRTLQARIQELEGERRSPPDAEAKIWRLEETCDQLKEENTSLRLQLQQKRERSTSPRDSMPDELAVRRDRILRLREELAAAETEVSNTASAPAAHSVRSSMVQSSSSRSSPEQPTKLLTASHRDRIKDLEREMAAVHRDTLSIDGLQRMPRGHASISYGYRSAQQPTEAHLGNRRHSTAACTGDDRHLVSDVRPAVPDWGNRLADALRPQMRDLPAAAAGPWNVPLAGLEEDTSSRAVSEYSRAVSEYVRC